MNPSELEQVVRDYIPRVSHLSLATCSGGRPWTCELHFGYDDALNLYFRSLGTRRHSREIDANPAVAGSIVTQHTPAEPPLGVFFEGRARRLATRTDQSLALDCLCRRLPVDPQALSDASRPDGFWLYAISVDTYFVYGGFAGQARQRYALDWSLRSTH